MFSVNCPRCLTLRLSIANDGVDVWDNTDNSVTSQRNDHDARPELEIDISRQWTIGPPVLEIWWPCQISDGPDVASPNRQYLFVKSNTADIIYLFLL